MQEQQQREHWQYQAASGSLDETAMSREENEIEDISLGVLYAGGCEAPVCAEWIDLFTSGEISWKTNHNFGRFAWGKSHQKEMSSLNITSVTSYA